MYLLHCVDDDRDLGTATGLTGFFVDSEQEWRTFRTVGFAPLVAGLPTAVDNLEIRVTGPDGDVLGAYAVSAARLEPDADPVVSGYLLDFPGPDDEVAWRLLRDEGLRRSGAWRTLSEAQKWGWLTAVRLHTDLLAAVPDVTGGRYDLDGRDVTDEPSFYCAVGEALRGPGGYYGGGLDAFGDCLHGGFGVRAPFTLRWRSIGTARAALGEPLFSAIMTTMRAAGVSVEATGD